MYYLYFKCYCNTHNTIIRNTLSVSAGYGVDREWDAFAS